MIDGAGAASNGTAGPSSEPKPDVIDASSPKRRPSVPEFAFGPRAADVVSDVTCTTCGASNRAGLRFCNSCGASLPVSEAAPPSARAPASGAPNGNGVAPLAPAPAAALAPAPPLAPPRPVTAGATPMPARIAPTPMVDVGSAPKQVPPTVRVCARCRGVCDPVAQFCKFCGAALGEPVAREVVSASPPSMGPATVKDSPVAFASSAPPGAAPRASAPPAPVRRPPPAPVAAPPAPPPPPARSAPPQPPAPPPVPAAPVAAAAPAPPPPPPPAPAPTPTPIAVVAAASPPIAPAIEAPVPSVPTRVEGTLRGRLIVIAKDGGEGASYPITERVDIGRTEGDIVIGEDRYLSPRHARVVFSPTRPGANEGNLVLRDLGSVNGVFVRLPKTPKDARPLEVPLRDQDLILLGQQVIRFEIVKDAEEGLGPAMQHGVLVFGTPASPRYARLSQRTVEGAVRDVFHVRKVETVLGRESGDVVFTDDPFLSRRHAVIRLDPAQKSFTLADFGSSNGTFLQIRGDVALKNGDEFRVGQQLFRVSTAS